MEGGDGILHLVIINNTFDTVHFTVYVVQN